MLEPSGIGFPIDFIGIAVERPSGPGRFLGPSGVPLEGALLEGRVLRSPLEQRAPALAVEHAAGRLEDLESVPLGVLSSDAGLGPVQGRHAMHGPRPRVEHLPHRSVTAVLEREMLQRLPSAARVLELLDVATRAVAPDALRAPVPVGAPVKESDEPAAGAENQMHRQNRVVDVEN